MDTENPLKDLAKAAANYRLLADLIASIKDTPLAKDPHIVDRIEELHQAMVLLGSQMSVLIDLADSIEAPPQRKKPSLHLVKK
ncbi:hypothetical protein [Pseudomonas sp.]|uniref:hypothetical protein n=1 Tax=Pseudomonas sp. TaxID=306 RepID=UPI0028AA92C8|nr:hypothetical protein [Pseudomonas sp.]